MPVAAVFIGFIAVETGIAAAIGTALASTVGLSVAASGVTASLAAGTISAATAVAVGSGVVSAGVSLAQGNSLSDALKGAVIGGVASFAGAGIASSVTSSISAAATDAGLGSIASSIGKVSGAMAGGAASSAIQAVASGKDPIDALIKGGLTAGLSAGVSEGINYTTSKIPGFNDLGKDYGGVGEAAQRAIKAGLTSGILGKDVSSAVLNSVVGSVNRVGGDYVKDLASDLKSAYNNANNTSNTLDENYAQQKQIIDEHNLMVADVEKNRLEIKDNFDKYNELKDKVLDYDTNTKKAGYTNLDDDGNYVKYIFGGTVNVPAGYNENGYHEAYSYRASEDTITGREIARSRDSYLQETKKYATLVTNALPTYEEQVADAKQKIETLSTKLDELKTTADPLEKTLTDQKAVLQTNVQNYLTQEEVNAQNIAKAVAEAEAAKTRIEAATGTTLTQEQLDAIVKTGDVKTAADDFIKTNTPTNVVAPVNTTTTEAPPTTVTQPTSTETSTVTQPTGADAISAQDIRDFIATHSEEEIKAAMERTGVTQAQVDAATAASVTTVDTAPVTTTAPVTVTTEAPVTSPVTTAPVTSVVTTDTPVTLPVTTETPATTTSAGPSAEVIRDFVQTHTPEEVQAAMIQFNVSQAQVDAAMNSAVAPVVNPPPVVQPPVDTVVAPPPVVQTPVVEPPPVAPVVNPPPVVAPPVVEQPPVVQPPVVTPPVLPPVVETPVVQPPVTTPVVSPPVYVPPENLIPITTPVFTPPPAETVTDLEKVFPTVAEKPVVEKPVLPTGGLETITSNLQNPIAVPTTAIPVTQETTTAPGGLNTVSGNLVDTGSGLQMPDLSKTAGSMATNFLKSKLTPAKRATTAPKLSSVPRLASTPVGGLSAVKAPVKAAAAPRVDVSKLIPVQKAVAPPKTLPSNAKLTPVKNIANLTSLVKKVG